MDMVGQDVLTVASAMGSALGVVVTVALMAARPTASQAAARRHRAAQAASAARDPRSVRTSDVAARLRAEGLEPRDVALVLDAAERRLVDPVFLWAWAERFGARELAVAVVGGLTTAELATALMRGRCPDLTAPAVLAGVQGLDPALCTPELDEPRRGHA